jgi:NAD(P)-dependent dehydrogenase (short-subunit alcohol dehydrogenase family)
MTPTEDLLKLDFLQPEKIENTLRAYQLAKCPAGRPGTADEIADVAELILSERAQFITGSTFLIDGGATASYYYGPLQPGLETGMAEGKQ